MVIDYCKNEPRIKYHRHEQNIGMIKNAEYSMRRFQGDYLVHLNDDDWLDLDYVEHSVKFLEQNPDYAFVSPQTRLYSREDSSAEPRLMYAPKLDDEKVISRLKKYVASQDKGMISSGCFRASIIRDCLMADNFTYKNRYNEDIVFLMKFLAKGKAKILTITHYNKLNDGHTMSLETTTADIYSTKGITETHLRM